MRPGTPKTRKSRRRLARCIVIAGPNGAGKTTFARSWLPNEKISDYLNADEIARGLSPLDPQRARVAAARVLFERLDELKRRHRSFAFESTLSGYSHLTRLVALKKSGYSIEIVFLRLSSPEVAISRVAARVKQGGHDVPAADIRRRFDRGLKRFEQHYRPIADKWAVYDNTGAKPVLIESGP